MRRHHVIFLGVVTVLLGAAIVARAAASIAPDSRVFELRIYTAAPGKLEALDARFRDHAHPLFAKHGMTVIAYWRGTDRPDTFMYMLAFKDRAAREAAWKAFTADPAWQTARAASEVDGPLIGKSDVLFLGATEYSPLK